MTWIRWTHGERESMWHAVEHAGVTFCGVEREPIATHQGNAPPDDERGVCIKCLRALEKMHRQFESSMKELGKGA